jgi:hypothetical protein
MSFGDATSMLAVSQSAGIFWPDSSNLVSCNGYHPAIGYLTRRTDSISSNLKTSSIDPVRNFLPASSPTSTQQKRLARGRQADHYGSAYF